MPHVLPGMPNAAPGAPQMMQSQPAGGVTLGCVGCAEGSFLSRVPLWAKIAVPVGLIVGTIIIAIILSNRRKVAPFIEAFESDEIDY